MGIKADERANYNRMVRDINALNRFLLGVYSDAQSEVEAAIAVFRQKQITSPATPGSLIQLARLEALNAEITDILNDVTKQTRTSIKTGYVKEWNDTYLNSAFNYEKVINTGALGGKFAFDIDLKYRHLNNDFIRSVFNAPIGGQTFTQRTLRDRLVLQSQVKNATAQAIVEGLSTKELAQRLEAIDSAFARGSNQAALTAQQELSTAYSYGQRDAIDTAVDNGVDGVNEWNATLDGRTRKDHAIEDGQKRDEKTRLFTLADGSTIQQPRIVGQGTAGLKQIMRCRCRMLFLPFGIRSTQRAAKMADGSWEDVNGDMTWQEWSKTIEGQRTIEEEKAYRKARNKRLAARREAA
jgi:hypothetical protein